MTEQDKFRQARIADERRRLKPAPWQFVPSQVFDCDCPYTPDAVGFHSWIAATAQCEQIIANDPEYFNRPPKG